MDNSNNWISVEDEPMPLEQFIIVSHPYGIEAINFHSGGWRYWYANKFVKEAVLRSITHWFKPQPPKNLNHG